MRLLVHPHIVRLYEVKETESHIYVVMEYMKCGELFDYITQKGRIHEDEARHFFQQVWWQIWPQGSYDLVISFGLKLQHYVHCCFEYQ